MRNATAHEAQVLDLIARNEFQPLNGAYPTAYEHTTHVWTLAVASDASYAGMTSERFAACIARLIWKGFVVCYYGDRQMKDQRTLDPDTIIMTSKGFAAWQKRFPVSGADNDAGGTKCAGVFCSATVPHEGDFCYDCEYDERNAD